MPIRDYSMDWQRVRSDLEALQSPAEMFELLRGLPLDLVGQTLMHLSPEYEGPLRGKLPRMGSEEVQKNWTGASGYHLLQQTTAFVRAVEGGYRRFTGRALEGAMMLDYGCGWGRILRLMYRFTAPENLYGCDPWDRSIEICKDDGIIANLAVSDYLPKKLPFPEAKFDVIYAFSVFTHLSERSAKTAIDACRKSIKDEGLLAITIRPLSYWDAHQESQGKVNREKMKSLHTESGFAFTPHQRASVDGDITYGDTSISLDYIAKNWKGWEVVGQDWQLHDPYQIIVFLKPV
jgi:hypothetical protein